MFIVAPLFPTCCAHSTDKGPWSGPPESLRGLVGHGTGWCQESTEGEEGSGNGGPRRARED